MGLLTILEVAQRLRVHPRTVRRYIAEGRLVATPLSAGGLRVSEEHLLSFSEDKPKPKAIKSALDSFLGHDYSGEPGQVRAFSIVDIFCATRDQATLLAQHLTSTVVYGGSHGDHGSEDSDSRFEFRFLAPQAKARFVLYGSPAWQGQALGELATKARELHGTAKPEPVEATTLRPLGSAMDRYGYGTEE